MQSTVTALFASDYETRLQRLAQLSVGLIVLSIGFSISGTLLLKAFPSLIGVFGPYYATLVKAPTWTYMAALPVAVWALYAPAIGSGRMLRFFLWGSVIGGASELLGTTTGFPFGEYTYTGWLGPKAFGHVPYFIPLSWFALGTVSYDLAGRVATTRMGRIAGMALIMTLWDVSLDPAMSRAFPFWTYPGGGFFYGMPLSNWAGWLAVSAVIAAGFEWTTGGRTPRSERAPFLYALNCAFPLALSVLYGLWWAVLAGLLATGAVLWAVWRADRSRTPR